MKKGKDQWVGQIMDSLENANPNANQPSMEFTEALKLKLHAHALEKPKIVSLKVTIAVAAGLALLLAANLFVMARPSQNHADAAESFMQQEGLYPIIPFENQ